MGKKKISLILGSGGARGYAHIGVIEELEKHGFEIISISGSSMGALIGGIYACGKLNQYKEWVCNLDAFDVASLLDISFMKNGGLIEGDKIFEKIKSFTGKVQIEELPIKFTAVSTDIVRQKEIWFQRGDVLEAIRASIAIPSIFTPIHKDSMILVDGGVLNPLPVAPTMSDMTDISIAVNLYSDVPKPKLNMKDDKEDRFLRIKEKVLEVFDHLSAKSLATFTMLDVLDKSLDTMQKTLTQYRLGGYKPDHIIDVSMHVCDAFDFHKAEEVIEVGRISARKFLTEYENNLKSVM